MRYITSTFLLLALAFAVPAFAHETALATPKGEDAVAAMHNDAGIQAFNKNLFAEAEGHFREAAKADPKFAEAHYNLGLALHEQKNHTEAAVHFKEARSLANGNKAILESKILLHHVSMN